MATTHGRGQLLALMQWQHGWAARADAAGDSDLAELGSAHLWAVRLGVFWLSLGFFFLVEG